MAKEREIEEKLKKVLCRAKPDQSKIPALNQKNRQDENIQISGDVIFNQSGPLTTAQDRYNSGSYDSAIRPISIKAKLPAKSLVVLPIIPLRRFSHFVIVSFLAIFLGCAVAPMPQHQHFIESNNLPQPDPIRATVYFYKPSGFVGGCVSYFVYDETDRIGALRNGGYFIYSAEPGDHKFWSETENVSSVSIKCSPEESYYIEGGVIMGFSAGNPNLTVMDKDVAPKRIQGLQYYEFDFTKEAPEPIESN